jgi:DNA invertase Pin-like site-specific DNA recombinase
MVYGYCRISTRQQSIDRQIRNIKSAFPDSCIVQEVYTGTKIERPEWKKLLKRIKEGDTVIFDSVSRMSRNADEGIQTYFQLMEKGINLVFLKEGYIDTDTYKSAVSQSISCTGNDIADIYIEATNRVIRLLAEKQIRKAFEQSEKEVQDLHQRTKEGIETARLNGKQIGIPEGKKLTTKKSIACKAVIREHSIDFSGTLNDADCMKLTGLSRNTYYKYKREIRMETESLE